MSTGFHSQIEDTICKKLSVDRRARGKICYNGISKAKECVINSKCKKLLKNKLKKYKLRKDGNDDPDVLEISKSFHISLTIKSPQKQNKSYLDLKGYKCEEFDVSNYLIKMIKNKRTVKEGPLGKESTLSGTIISNGRENDPKIDDNKCENVFDLMMNSRNKSIGSNSPGKDKNNEEEKVDNSEEKQIQRTMKLKRTLALKRMAEAKGSLDKKDLEELKDKFIKKKMDDRARRLKKKLKDNVKVTKYKSKEITKSKHNRIYDEKSSNLRHEQQEISMPILDDSATLEKVETDHDTFYNVPLIDNDKCSHNSSKRSNICKDDDDFLKKLSPSIKNRNMLCYFKKVEKDLQIHEVSKEIETDNNIIKVKFTSKCKKEHKIKLSRKDRQKKTNGENKCENEDDLKQYTNIQETAVNLLDENNFTNESPQMSIINRKRKRQKVEMLLHHSQSQTAPKENIFNETNRPKRNARKPVKYSNIELTSSDEELNIFIPRKKKAVEVKDNLRNTKGISNNDKSNKIAAPKKLKTLLNIKGNNAKKSEKKKDVKLAPIFMTKSQAVSVSLKAKQKCHVNEVPKLVNKIMQIQTTRSIEENAFFSTTHVQQIISNGSNYKKPIINLYDLEHDEDAIVINSFDSKKFLHVECNDIGEKHNLMFKNDVLSLLQNIKKSYPNFPVYRTYRLLKNKSDEVYDCVSDLDNSIEVIDQINCDNKMEQSVHLTWTEKYRVLSSKDIIGNFDSNKELKKWLQSWQENEVHSQRNCHDASSDSSDFYYNSDTDSRNSIKSANNLLIITGPVGSGKTSSVYAVAEELSMKVIEVNASSKRTGKIILQDLQEATQSHKVNRTKTINSDFSQNSQELVDFNALKKTKRKQKRKFKDKVSSKTNGEAYVKTESLSQSTYSQETRYTEMSLILIDDADIIFDQDDGFTPALSQIIQCSKRPVILITSSLTVLHLQKFFQCGNIVKMQALLPRMLGTWLDIMCLAGSGICCPGVGSMCLEYFRGDIRKSINYLQYLVCSEANIYPMGDSKTMEDQPSIEEKDESSSLSWVDHDSDRAKQTIHLPLNIFNERNLNFTTDLKPTTIWWNIPSLFYNSQSNASQDAFSLRCVERSKCKKLSSLADIVDSFSLADFILCSNQNSDRCLISETWHLPVSDSVSDVENYEEYNSYKEDINQISNYIINSSLSNIQPLFEIKDINLCLPDFYTQREEEKTVSRHRMLASGISTSSTLNRRALATDYWSVCRDICRIEKENNGNNSKRYNRYCHYLTSIKVECKKDIFEKLGDSLTY